MFKTAGLINWQTDAIRPAKMYHAINFINEYRMIASANEASANCAATESILTTTDLDGLWWMRSGDTLNCISKDTSITTHRDTYTDATLTHTATPRHATTDDTTARCEQRPRLTRCRMPMCESERPSPPHPLTNPSSSRTKPRRTEIVDRSDLDWPFAILNPEFPPSFLQTSRPTCNVRLATHRPTTALALTPGRHDHSTLDNGTQVNRW